MTAKKPAAPVIEQHDHDEDEALRYLTAASVLTREIVFTLHAMECHDGMALDFASARRLRAYVESLDVITDSLFDLALSTPEPAPLKAVPS